MPIFAYKCECGNQEEELFKINNIPDKYICPECGKEMQKVYGKVNVQYKGTGWTNAQKDSK